MAKWRRQAGNFQQYHDQLATDMGQMLRGNQYIWQCGLRERRRDNGPLTALTYSTPAFSWCVEFSMVLRYPAQTRPPKGSTVKTLRVLICITPEHLNIQLLTFDKWVKDTKTETLSYEIWSLLLPPTITSFKNKFVHHHQWEGPPAPHVIYCFPPSIRGWRGPTEGRGKIWSSRASERRKTLANMARTERPLIQSFTVIIVTGRNNAGERSNQDTNLVSSSSMNLNRE